MLSFFRFPFFFLYCFVCPIVLLHLLSIYRHRDLNKLIMNYLIIEGYKDAAEKFSHESGAKPPVNLESIQDRMIVRTAIQRGNIEEAIERVNDLNPEVMLVKEGECSFTNSMLCPAKLQRYMSLFCFEIYRFWTPTQSCFSTFSSKDSLSTSVKAGSWKRSSLHRRNWLLEAKRT